MAEDKHLFTPKSPGSTSCIWCPFAEAAHPAPTAEDQPTPAEQLRAKLENQTTKVPANLTLPHTHISAEVLKAQDGNVVPLTLENGGPVVGTATMCYVEGEGLFAEMTVTDPKVAAALQVDDSFRPRSTPT